MKELAEFVRALVRPAVTFGLVGAATYAILQAIVVPDWYQVMAGMALAYWFADRSQRKAPQ